VWAHREAANIAKKKARPIWPRLTGRRLGPSTILDRPELTAAYDLMAKPPMLHRAAARNVVGSLLKGG
jgi:hypothetical protein